MIVKRKIHIDEKDDDDFADLSSPSKIKEEWDRPETVRTTATLSAATNTNLKVVEEGRRILCG